MYEDSISSDDSDNGLENFIELPDGTKWFGIEDYCREVECSKSELLEWFGNKTYLLLKYSKNSKRLLASFNIDQLACFNETYLRTVLCFPKNVLRLTDKAEIDLEELSQLSQNHLKLFIEQYNEVINLINANKSITFDQLSKLPIDQLERVLSKSEEILNILNKQDLTFKQFIKLLSDDQFVKIVLESVNKPIPSMPSFFNSTAKKY